MCGVIGVHLEDVKKEDLKLIQSLFLQSMIRGKHATGVSFYSCGKIHTIKEPIPADKFIEKYDVREFVDPATLSITLIGHTRYSTSDLRHNQPFQGRDTAIAHNGVISQDPDLWEYKTETGNDSELILRCIEQNDHPLEVYKNRSMAVVVLDGEELHAFRNHERPLWFANLRRGVVFSSTKDILKRSGVTEGIHQCEPLVKYTVGKHACGTHVCGMLVDRTYFDKNLKDLQP
jgi:glutamine phosphoribosylpyrophosphate amidotransferase